MEIKSFEKYIHIYNGKNNFYLVIQLHRGVIDNVYLFENEESADNYVINKIHGYYIKKGEKDYECKDVFDVSDLLYYWNENESDEIHYYILDVEDKVQIDPELRLRMDANKFNL